jgi:acyl carrier protein
VMSMVFSAPGFFTGLVCDARPEVAGAERVLGMYLNTVPFALPAGAQTWGDLVRAVYADLTAMWPHRAYPMAQVQQELGGTGRLLDIFFNYLDFHQVDGGLIDEDQTYNDNDNESALHVFTLPGLLKFNTTNHRLNRAGAARLADLYRTVLREMSFGPDGDATSACLPPAERPQPGADPWPVATGVVAEVPGTGRLARRAEDGTLQELGPVTQRRRVHGRLVEPYRSRELLDTLPGVLDSWVVWDPDPAADRLVGYVRTAGDTDFDAAAARQALAAARAPRYLIPDALVGVDAWPLTGAGSIDVSRLPEAPAAGEDAPADERPWDDQFETLLRDALDAASFDGPVTPDLSLADAGMDSFGTVGLLVALEQAFGITIPDDVPVMDMFRTPTSLWRIVAGLRDEN